MLIIPVIHIAGNRCTDRIVGHEDIAAHQADSPIAHARHWRSENFKALQLNDESTPERIDLTCLRDIVCSVDIPIQYRGRITTVEDAERCFATGITRVVIPSALFDWNEMLHELLRRFGARKTVLEFTIDQDEGLHSHRASIRKVEAIGLGRIVLRYPEESRISFGDISEVLRACSMKITVHGGVFDYHSLQQLEEFNLARIDSLILDSALYRNVFPCQQIWRSVERKMSFASRKV